MNQRCLEEEGVSRSENNGSWNFAVLFIFICVQISTTESKQTKKPEWACFLGGVTWSVSLHTRIVPATTTHT